MSEAFPQLRGKIEQRTAKIAIIGLGYVGLPMCMEFTRAGFKVVGIDIDPARVSQLKDGHSYILDVSDDLIASLRENFIATTSYSVLEQIDVVVICVPTPLSKTRDPDLSFILAATSEIAKHLHAGQLIVLESTTYPGTTDEIVLPDLEKITVNAMKSAFIPYKQRLSLILDVIKPGYARAGSC